jgi:hypothetical protein
MRRQKNRGLRQFVLAEEAFAQGARCKVVQKITALAPTDIKRLFTDEAKLHSNTGNMPSSIDWFVGKRSNMAGVQASHFYSYFWHQIDRGIDALEALIVAYRLYSRKCFDNEKMDFDRAFFLITATHGFWAKKKQPSLEAARCSDCESLHIGHLGLRYTARQHCPICKARRVAMRSSNSSVPVVTTAYFPAVAPFDEAMPVLRKAVSRRLEGPVSL